MEKATYSQVQPFSNSEDQQSPVTTKIFSVYHPARGRLLSFPHRSMTTIDGANLDHDFIWDYCYSPHRSSLIFPSPPATEAQLKAHGPLHNVYTSSYWNPRQEPVLNAGNVFDIYSLRRWILCWIFATVRWAKASLRTHRFFRFGTSKLLTFYKLPHCATTSCDNANSNYWPPAL